MADDIKEFIYTIEGPLSELQNATIINSGYCLSLDVVQHILFKHEWIEITIPTDTLSRKGEAMVEPYWIIGGAEHIPEDMCNDYTDIIIDHSVAHSIVERYHQDIGMTS